MDNNQQKLTDLISSLPKELSPQQDLWHQIEHRLHAPLEEPAHSRPTKQSWQWLAVASALIFAVLLSTHQTQTQTVDTTSPVNGALLATMKDIRLAHEQQILEFKQVSQLTHWQNSPYSAPVETGIEQLRLAAKQIYQTLKNNPTDKQLWQLWLWTQQREIELIRQGQKLPLSPKTQGEMI